MISRKIASASCVGGDNDVLEWEVAKRREMKPFLACKRERSGWKTRRKRRKTHLHRRVDEGGGRSDGRSAVKGGHRGRVGSVEGSSCGENGEEWKMTECGGEREENRRNCFSSFACQRRKRRVILPYLHRPRKPDSPDVHRTLRRKKTRKSDSTFRA
jgi:hypothetical protein